MKQIKGSSSHFIDYEIEPNGFFKCQGSYAALAVSHESLARLVPCIEYQERYHHQTSSILDWEVI